MRHVSVGIAVTSLLVACGAMGGAGGTTSAILGAACPELHGGAMNASFEADARANATIRAFVTASGDLAAVAARAEAEVGQACANIARDLGAAPGELEPRRGESRVAAACRVASARIDGILAQGARASMTAHVTPPACQVRADAEAQCRAQCAGSIDPGYVKAHCKPGHLYGRCNAACTGECRGTCNGQCNGACAGATGAGGQCNGQCQGTCNGSCSGECHGSCSVDFQEPKCDVAVQAPSADVRCDGSCRAHANLEAQCTPAQVDVRASVETGEMQRLIATLRANLPALIQVEIAYGSRIAGDVDTLVRTGADLPRAFGQLTAHAGACVGAAADACFSAQASLRVSVQASASISAKAGAHGGT